MVREQQRQTNYQKTIMYGHGYLAYVLHPHSWNKNMGKNISKAKKKDQDKKLKQSNIPSRVKSLEIGGKKKAYTCVLLYRARMKTP